MFVSSETVIRAELYYEYGEHTLGYNVIVLLVSFMLHLSTE